MAKYAEHGSILLDAGDTGGDYQDGDSARRRFFTQEEDGTFTVVDVYVYVTTEYLHEDRDEEDQFWDFEVQTFLTRCTDVEDPEMSEIGGGDVEYDNPSYAGFPSRDKAWTAAINYLKSIDAARDLS